MDNTARAMAMKLCQERGSMKLAAIGKVFGVGSGSGVSKTITRLTQRLLEDEVLQSEYKVHCQDLTPCLFQWRKNIMHRKYIYDPDNAQLVEREDILPVIFDDIIVPTLKETFTYDKHRRIKTNQLSYGLTVSDFYTYEYDKLGNITSKPDSGYQNYEYGQGITLADNAGPHAITSVDGRNFTYDASGNLLNDGDREARWKSFQKPSMLRKLSSSATIWLEYGAGNNRTRRRQGNFNTWYLDGGADVQIERLTNNNIVDVTTKYHYVANGNVVGIDTETASGTEARYLHSDRLGSASVLTDSTGQVLEQMSYDVWGKVRNVTNESDVVLKSAYHTKSYTGHEALADVDLVHMNGRIYDPILGRFKRTSRGQVLTRHI